MWICGHSRPAVRFVSNFRPGTVCRKGTRPLVLAAAAETVRPVTLPTHGNDQGFVRRDLAWSRAEKAIARRAFQSALEQELEALVEQAKRMAQRIEHPSELWKLEEFLTRRGNEIDRKYDYNIRFCRPCSRGYSRNTD
jgi:Photoprotection regulator fluorescence recovery protein